MCDCVHVCECVCIKPICTWKGLGLIQIHSNCTITVLLPVNLQSTRIFFLGSSQSGERGIQAVVGSQHS